MTDQMETYNDASPYLAGNFAPVTEELTAYDLPVIGEIPVELEGRLLRNGPNPIGETDVHNHHWFLGDGMVHGVRLRGGKAEWYRNRFVGSQRTTELLGQTAPKPLTGNTGPNTNVIGHAGKTFAIVEAGTKPVELTYELETVGTNGFGDSLLNGYTAHPKYDPLTGEMHAMCYAPQSLGGMVEYIVVGPDGTMTKTVQVATPGMPMMHDMGLTQTYAVILDLPVAVDIELALNGSPFPMRWFDEYDARIGLLPRTATSGDEVIWCEIEPCYAFHPLNSYDLADGRVVVDICRYDRLFDLDRNGPFRDSPPQLERWTVDPVARRVKREVIDERFQEFPRVAGSVLNVKHQYGYTSSVGLEPGDWSFGDTIKYDFDGGTSEAFDHGTGRGAGEPVFVSRADGTAEDDGWILTVVNDETTNRSDLVILDAQDFSRPEVARIELPARVPYGFHGNWVRDTVTPPPVG
ncbi:MAG: carotenoid oxygenase family protein [Actinomycetota bacterium]